jgi:TPR repeat protein
LRAAEQSEAKAQFDLASLYAKGRGMAEDHEAAAMWYERSASNGYYPAQARLGYLYANGIGVKKSRVQAFLWLSLAAQHGVGSALKALEEVGRQMSVEEKAQGGQLLDHWRRKLGRSGAMRLNPVLG